MCNKRSSTEILYRPKERRIKVDSCMVNIVNFINFHSNWKSVACCCGHGRYSPSLLLKSRRRGNVFDVFSGKEIKRKRNFYRKDADGYYYIPEAQVE